MKLHPYVYQVPELYKEMESAGCTPDRKAREILQDASLILHQKRGCEFSPHILCLSCIRSLLLAREKIEKPIGFLLLQMFERFCEARPSLVPFSMGWYQQIQA